jgi:pSer/pThr/pTyr-binding forkhead associated (FHA) protein
MPRVTITVPEKNAQPYRFALERQSVSLGRGSENDIVIDCPSVSVNHAVMERTKGGYRLRDLESTNGIKLDGKASPEIELTDGAEAKVGDVAFGFSLTPDEQMMLAKERPDEEAPIIKEEAYESQASPRGLPRQPLASAQQTSAAAGFFMTLLFLLLAAAAFYIGLGIRYQKETGRALTPDLKNPPAEEAAATASNGESVEADEASAEEPSEASGTEE